jgi:hypothetical protein
MRSHSSPDDTVPDEETAIERDRHALSILLRVDVQMRLRSIPGVSDSSNRLTCFYRLIALYQGAPVHHMRQDHAHPLAVERDMVPGRLLRITVRRFVIGEIGHHFSGNATARAVERVAVDSIPLRLLRVKPDESVLEGAPPLFRWWRVCQHDDGGR